MNQIITDMTDEEYFAAKGLSKHTLDAFVKAPAYYQWRLVNPIKPSRSMELGTLIHQQALQGVQNYAVAPACDRRTKEGKLIWQNFCEENLGKIVVSEEEAATVRGCCEAVKHIVEPLLERDRTNAELAMFWERDGIQCKGKADIVCGNGNIFDLKTTSDIHAFDRSFWNFRYHIQAAWYIGGLKQLAPKLWDTEFAFIVVDTNAPYLAQVVRVKPETLHAAALQIEREFQHYKTCLANDDWPGLPAERLL